MNRVKLEEVCERVDAGQVVDSDELNVVTALEQFTGDGAADATKAVNSDANAHSQIPSFYGE